jgi:aminoglycoside 3-N-acetyltransferase
MIKDHKATPRLSSIRDLQTDLLNLGVVRGDALMVHSSLRKVGPCEERGAGLITALLQAVGPEGTVMAYADFEPSKDVPYFDPKSSPARPDYGVFPELLRQWPGAFRSENPGASMVAVGARAQWLTENHPIMYGYGPDSPLHKFTSIGGKVLLLGSDPDQVTILHLAEHVADLPNKRIVRREIPALKQNGTLASLLVEEFDTSDPVVETMPPKIFEKITQTFIASQSGKAGRVGQAEAHLLPAKELVEFAVSFMEREFGARTV